MYFRDMARLAVLRPQEEFESARKLEALEIALWARMLQLRAGDRARAQGLRAHARELARRSSRSLRKHRSDAARSRRQGGAGEARALRGQDVARSCARSTSTSASSTWCSHELQKIIRGAARAASSTTSLDFNDQVEATFKKYLRDVRTAYSRAHDAKNEFVKANLRLVVSIARRFNYGRMPLADLIQEGNIGLIKAVERYDYRRGYRFSTYASWWIRHAISRALADKGRAVRLPVHMIDAYHRVAKSQARAVGQARAAADQRGARRGDRHRARPKIEKMRTFLLDQSFSLDKTVRDEDGRKFIDFIQDPNAENSHDRPTCWWTRR